MSEPSVRRFIEAFDFGRHSNRTAYVVDAARLPVSLPGAYWQEDTSFDETAEFQK